MTKTVFTDPFGESFENPEREWLRNLIFNEGDDFWDADAGDAGIDFYEDDKRVSFLHLKGLEEFGFKVAHQYKRVDEPRYTLTFGQHSGETIEAYIGGQPSLYFREYFVPREVAWDAINHFLNTGERKLSLHWEKAVMPEQAF